MSLLSLEFLALSVAAIVIVRAAPEPMRTVGFAGVSLWFATSYLDTTGLLATLLFCLAGYAIARGARRNARVGTWGIALLTLWFVWMQHYSFLELFVPERWLPTALVGAGLSFLFFKIVHVIVDSAGGTIGDLRFTVYLNYCLNFTAWLLGPIQRYQGFESQWSGREDPLPPTLEAHLDALNRVLRGLVKKYVIAETLAAWALMPGQDVTSQGLGEVVIGVYVFYVFLYFDFSGYCDVVIGIGRLMGVRPPENFNFPFLSPNIAQFWLRVHRSLTLWLTDYVFNPSFAALLRSRRFASRSIVAASMAIMLTMFVSGLWHGTTANFLLFGLVHGVYLVAFRVFEHELRRRLGRKRLLELRKRRLWVWLSTFLTFNVTALAYVFFVLDAASLWTLVTRLWTRVPW